MVFFAYVSDSQKILVTPTNVGYDKVSIIDKNIELNADGSVTFRRKGTYAVDVNVNIQEGAHETVNMYVLLNGNKISGGGIITNIDGDSTTSSTSNIAVEVKNGDNLAVVVKSTYGNEAVCNNNGGSASSLRISRY